MRFRTEIETYKSNVNIKHNDGGIMLLGSCFTDNIGQCLKADGFDVCHNPMGPLYNPVSLANFIMPMLTDCVEYQAENLVQDSNGIWHSLDFPMRYNQENPQELLTQINKEYRNAHDFFNNSKTIIVTFGTAWVFKHTGLSRIISNCHKFPASDFERQRLSVEDIIRIWSPILSQLKLLNKNVIFTISPIRHLADGLHGNQISKSILQLAIDQLGCEYFPAYEIMIDDLRDYRFYADDLKHPSPMAIEYIYTSFKDIYFTDYTRCEAKKYHDQWLMTQHRQL